MSATMRPGSNRARVAVALWRGPRTLTRVAVVTGLDPLAVANAIESLRQRGAVQDLGGDRWRLSPSGSAATRPLLTDRDRLRALPQLLPVEST